MANSRFGGDAAGFSVEYDAKGQALRVRGWGFWTAEIGRSFGVAVLDAYEAHHGVRQVVMDMLDLKPMREEGQVSFAHVVNTLAEKGATRVLVTVSSQLTRLQLLRLAGTRAKEGFIEVTTASSDERGRADV